MNRQRAAFIGSIVIPAGIFLAITIFLTFNILSLPSLVVGDNFYWNKATITDVLGSQIVHQSYMGDIGVLSTFKNGFLFPVALVLDSFHLPITLIYPFFFYFFSMISFYFLSGEFLKRKYMRIIVSAIYVVNPVIPYYFASLLSSFIIVFLPLVLKFFIRTLRQIDQRPGPFLLSSNFALSAVFLGLTISAHEQFIVSSAVIAIFILITFSFYCYLKYGKTRKFLRTVPSNVLIFVLIVVAINIPLLISLSNFTNAPLSTYFTQRIDDFVSNVKYTYAQTNLVTLLRFGGDSGSGLGQNSWYDSGAYSNIFGYGLLVFILISVFLLVKRKVKVKSDQAFFLMVLLLFVCSILLIGLVAYLPSNRGLLSKVFNLALQSWESPMKLRVILLLSALTLSLVAFQKLEVYNKIRKNRFLKVTLLIVLIASVVVYNSPWLIVYAGDTPQPQISDSLQWGPIFDQSYSKLSDFLQANFTDQRGIAVPYTHKMELYASPNFRMFQLVSDVNTQEVDLTQGLDVPWSKVLGLLSTKYVAVNNGKYNPNEILIFPKTYDKNMTRAMDEIKKDDGLKLVENFGNFTIYQNQNALPTIYATNYYVFYDDASTLNYALNLLNFTDLPVFVGSGGQINQLSIPTYIGQAPYQINALVLPGVSNEKLTLIAADGVRDRQLNLEKTGSSNGVDVYSTVGNLLPGDIVKVSNDSGWTQIPGINQQLTLNSTSYLLGNYGSFMLNFSVNMLENGKYSFLSPRVTIDSGETRDHLIFHDNGVLELAVSQGKFFTPGVQVSDVGYSLRSPSDSINVTVSKVFDTVQIWINGNMAMSFPENPNASTVSLTSEQSISQFTNVEVQTRNIVRLFAVRQSSTKIDFSTQQQGPNKSVLTVSNTGSDYAVVDQYLNSPLRNIDSPTGSHSVTANLFFNGWIINGQGLNSNETVLTIGIKDSQTIIDLTLLTIVFTYAMLIIGLVPPVRKITLAFVSQVISRKKKDSN